MTLFATSQGFRRARGATCQAISSSALDLHFTIASLKRSSWSTSMQMWTRCSTLLLELLESLQCTNDGLSDRRVGSAVMAPQLKMPKLSAAHLEIFSCRYWHNWMFSSGGMDPAMRSPWLEERISRELNRFMTGPI